MPTDPVLPWLAKPKRPIGWGIVGPGEIAQVFARAVNASGAGLIAYTVSRSLDRSQSFAEQFGGHATTHLEAMLDDDQVEAVYIATPHPMHAAAVEAALRSRKAVLCEKPMTTSLAGTQRLIRLSRSTGTPLVEAWMYRTHPQIARLLELVSTGAIGRVQEVEAVFGWASGGNLRERLTSPELGGGVILDIGGYPASFATMIARAVCGTTQAEPVVTSAIGHRIDTGVELHAECSVSFDDQLIATLKASAMTKLGLRATVRGERGAITLPQAFLPDERRDGRHAPIILSTAAGEHTETVSSPYDCFALEAIAVAHLIESRGNEPKWPMVDHSDSLAIAGLLDAWAAALPA